MSLTGLCIVSLLFFVRGSRKIIHVSAATYRNKYDRCSVTRNGEFPYFGDFEGPIGKKNYGESPFNSWGILLKVGFVLNFVVNDII